ncbi:uncharacterized protein LOC135695369 [Rhopilema esculentum]|uniref:uncharacterized protein LOC135695369 n=1 Tax=Rhopilema esculentum TaxID=499914 RepID=UPI0031DB0D58|eukprot:gene5299-464_t
MASAIIFTFICICLILFARCEERFVSNVLDKTRSSCPDMPKKVYTVTSEMQCIHRCMRNKDCSTINYRTENDVTENCEVFLGGHCAKGQCSRNWKTIVIKSELFPVTKVFKSCREVFLEKENAASGVYDLESGRHFCNMSEIPNCGGGGWTLAMKIDGTKVTFSTGSVYWSNDEVYNTELGIKSFYENEAKFPAFSNVAFDEICIGMRASSVVNWLRLPVNSSSLLAIFKPATYIQTNLGRSAWKHLLLSSSMQFNCNREGINVKTDGGDIMARIGLIANNEDDCASPDSFFGLGIASTICGNEALHSPNVDDGQVRIEAMGFVLIK